MRLKLVQRHNGAVIYQGPSRLDGQPIVAVVTGLRDRSDNPKTGDMLQTYVLRADVPPLDAVESGADASVCGDCVHRKVNGAGSCYVNVGQGPRAVYAAYSEDSYPTLDPVGLGAGRIVRLGTYGDPVAVPIEVWDGLLTGSLGHSGYTHQWKYAIAREYRRLLMASVETEAQMRFARRKGWRTFRVKNADEPALRGEAVCPASEEAGRRKTCQECLACDGAREGDRRVGIVIAVHGLAWKVSRYGEYRRRKAQRRRYRVKEVTG